VARVDNPELSELGDAKRSATATSLERRLDQLSAAHPSHEGHDDARRDRTPERFRPLTDAEHADHVSDVKARLADARKAGLGTENLYTIDPDQEFWSAEREAEHDAIIETLYAAALGVPCERKAVVAGGLPGSGKTTVLTEHVRMDLSKYVMINPDVVKEEMARRGLIPEVDGLTPLEASELVHEESSHVAKRLARRAQADGKNIIWDITMAKEGSAEGRIRSLRADGYEHITGIFVDIPLDTSVRRADARYREGHEAYRHGVGMGGRYVSDEMIRSQQDDLWGCKNRMHFEAVKDRFDAWSVYDNSVDGGVPALTASYMDPRHSKEVGG
jgi:predicted kinase